MKKIKTVICIVFALVSIVITSCKKEFLDKSPYDALAFDQAILNANDLALATNGMYASMRTSAFYGRTLPMMGDVMADNAYISNINSGRYLSFNNYVILSNNGEADEIWSSAYTTILRSNQCITADLPADGAVNQLKGEAYGVRALMYFELIRCFAHAYNGANQNDAGVPLVLTYDPSVTPARNTIGAVYDQIIADLNQAIALMTVQKKSEYFSPYVAKALLAKVYQYKGDWANAKSMAQDVVSASGYKLTDSANYVKYWADPAATTKSETMFEISLDGIENNGTNSLAAMYVQQSYGDALCDTALYLSYSTADVRRKLLSTGSHHGIPSYIVKKYTNQTNQTDKDDSKVLRLSEIYLLLAEACYRLGDEPNALINLNTIAQKREPSFAGYTSTGTILLEDIINERRKELAFEGNRYFDLCRLGRDIVRGAAYPSTALFIPFSDHRRILPIPLVEMDANPNITQNPGY